MTTYMVKTFQDIYTAVLDELKIPSSDTTSLNRIKRDINMAYAKLAQKPYKWTRKEFDVTWEAYYNTGTASVTKGSKTITLSTSITNSKQGFLFFTEGYAEVYRIQAHTAGSDTLTLETIFTGDTNSTSSFYIIPEGLELPVDIDDVYDTWHEHCRGSMESLGDRDFRNLVLNSPRRADRPTSYTISQKEDANPYDTISGLPALSTRASSGLVRTLVFASTVASYLSEGDLIRIHTADDDDYNGDWIIEDVATTTVQFVALTPKYENATADSNLVLELKNDESNNRNYTYMQVYPMLNDKSTTIHVDGIRDVPPLENDSDEPLIPYRQRAVLVYMALERGWRRIRNTEEAEASRRTYKEYIKEMNGELRTGKDFAQVKMSKHYLRGKRRGRKTNGWWSF